MSVYYDEYLDRHRQNVYKAYEWIKTNIPEVIPEDSNLEWLTGYSHDVSKNTVEEYYAYDQYFYGDDRTEEVIKNFNYAWLHHIHNNPHHWQYWILTNDDPGEGEIILEMPIDYAIEMICDWWAFSFAKGDLGEIFDWYEKRKQHIKLHPNTRKFVEDTLSKIKSKMKLEDTIGLMCSEDYRDRLKAEYLQLAIRIRDLQAYADKVEDRLSLQFAYIGEQLVEMKAYRLVLKKRLYVEGLFPDTLDAVCELEKY